MRRIIITPTFRPHFAFNRDFLDSFRQNATDAGEIGIHFVVADDERADLETILAEFPDIGTAVHSFEDLLRANGHEMTSRELLGEVEKFAFQALKKLYALKELEYDQALILDSESLLLKPTRVGDAFDGYFADPFVVFSDLSHRNDHWFGLLGDVVHQNVARLLGVAYPKMHLLEYYGWFYDRRIVDDMFAALSGDLLALVRQRLGKQKHIFECSLYYLHLFGHQDRYRHRFVSANDLMKRYLGEDGYRRYIANFTGPWEQVGMFEFVSKEVNDENLPSLLRLFNELELQFYRSELVNHNERAQEALIAASPITFLVSSENYRRIRERIAVCVGGPKREYRRNLKHLRDFLADSNVDVFCHLWEAPDRDVVLQALEPVAYEQDDDVRMAAVIAGVDLSTARRERFVDADRDSVAVAGLYSTWRANELKRAHERAEGFTYDVVVNVTAPLIALQDLAAAIDSIRARQRGFDRTLYVPARMQGTGLEGQLAIGSSSTMDLVAGLFGRLGDLAQQALFSPSHLLLRHVLEHGLEIQVFGFEQVTLVDEDQPLDLEGLQQQLGHALASWSTRQLPPILPTMVTEYFEATALSVACVAELELETPRAFRLLVPGGGYLRVEPSGALGFAVDERGADLFLLVVAGDVDRTAVNLRARQLVQTEDGEANVHADRRLSLRADGPASREAAFFLSRVDGGIALEWRSGFFLVDDRGPDRHPHRLWLGAGDAGPALVPKPTSVTVERVPDAVAEALPMGLRAEVSTAEPTLNDARLTRWTWRVYTAARVFEARGLSGVTADTKVFVRKLNHRSPQNGQSSGLRALVNNIAARVRN